MDLKDYRVSLKFSEKEAEQRDVVKLLKQLGRKKSSFITKAIKYYLENNPSPEIPGNNSILTNLITENMVKSTIMKMIQSGELSYNTNINKNDIVIKKEPSESEYVEKEIPKTRKVEKVEKVEKIEKAEKVKKPDNSVVENIDNDAVDNMLDMLEDFDF